MKKILFGFFFFCILGVYNSFASFSASSCVYGVLNTTSLTVPSLQCTGVTGIYTGNQNFGTVAYTIAPRTANPLNWIGLKSDNVNFGNCTYTAINTTTRTLTNVSCSIAQIYQPTSITNNVFDQVTMYQSGLLLNTEPVINISTGGGSSGGGYQFQDNVYIDPDFSLISDNIIPAYTGSLTNEFLGFSSQETAEEFCALRGGNFVSVTTLPNPGTYAFYDSAVGWTSQTANDRVDTVVCNEIVGGTGGSGISGGGLASSWTGSVDEKNYLQLFVFKDGQMYVNQDIWFYLLVMILLGIILVRTLIKISSVAFSSGFFLSSGQKILGKK